MVNAQSLAFSSGMAETKTVSLSSPAEILDNDSFEYGVRHQHGAENSLAREAGKGAQKRNYSMSSKYTNQIQRELYRFQYKAEFSPLKKKDPKRTCTMLNHFLS